MRLIFFIALRQLWDRKLLNGIALCGVTLGVLVLIAMNGIMQGFQMKFKGEILKVSPHDSVSDKKLGQEKSLLTVYFQKDSSSPQKMVQNILHEQPSDRKSSISRPYDWIHKIEAMEEVEAACVGLTGQATLRFGTQDVGVKMKGIVPASQERCTPLKSYVQKGSWQELSSIPLSVALGSGVADLLKANIGDQIRVDVPGQSPQFLKVVAIYEVGIPPIDKSQIYMDLITAQRILREPNTIRQIEIRLKQPFASIQFANKLEKLMGYDNESWQETNANFLSLFDLQNTIISMVVGAILVVGGFGILAIQIMIVLQKTKDISILRSVGLRRRDILLVFLIQGVIIAFLGALFGDFFGWRLVEFLGSLQIKQDGLVKSSKFLVYQDPKYYIYGIVFALLTGTVASLLPAWRGSKVEPVDVLRGQV